MAGEIKIPAPYSTPAARGMAITQRNIFHLPIAQTMGCIRHHVDQGGQLPEEELPLQGEQEVIYAEIIACRFAAAITDRD
jgi:hypothetical protein